MPLNLNESDGKDVIRIKEGCTLSTFQIGLSIRK